MKSVRMVLLLVISLIILMGRNVSAETKKVLSERNEFGGKTEETTYNTENEIYEAGVKKIIKYYDSNGKEKKNEFFSTDENAKKYGITRTILYIDGGKTEQYRNDKLINTIHPDSDPDPARDEIEGDYELISGPKICPDGTLKTLITDDGERVLLFGAWHSWPMNMKDESKVKEAHKDDCTYVWEYKKAKKRFDYKTTKSNCRSQKENGVVTETMILKGNKLTYESEFKGGRVKCQYKRVSD